MRSQMSTQARLEPKITPQLPAVNVNIQNSRSGKKEQVKKENRIQLVSQDQLHVKVENSNTDLDEEKLALSFQRVMTNNTKGAYNKLYKQIKAEILQDLQEG